MRSKSLMLLLLALGCGLVASIGINQAMSRPQGDAGVEIETAPIFVAKTEIGLGDVIKPEMVNLEPWPKDKIPPGAVGKLEDMEDRRARVKIFPGEAIIEPKLLAKGETGESANGLIPVGYRVVTVKVDAVSGGAGLLKPGDRVDVMVHLQENPARGVQKTVSKIFLQMIKILAVDDVFRRDDDGRQSMAAKTVSLLVTPAQAEMVTTAAEMGTIRLVMRNPNDIEPSLTDGSGAELILGNNPMETPSKPKGASFIDHTPVPVPVVEPKHPEPAVAVNTPPRNVFKMILLMGPEERKEVDFEDGKLVTTNENGSVASDAGQSTTSVDASGTPASDPPATDNKEQEDQPKQN